MVKLTKAQKAALREKEMPEVRKKNKIVLRTWEASCDPEWVKLRGGNPPSPKRANRG